MIDEAERLARELVALADVGVDVTDIGDGARRMSPAECAASPSSPTDGSTRSPCPLHLIAIVRVIPTYPDA